MATAIVIVKVVEQGLALILLTPLQWLLENAKIHKSGNNGFTVLFY